MLITICSVVTSKKTSSSKEEIFSKGRVYGLFCNTLKLPNCLLFTFFVTLSTVCLLEMNDMDAIELLLSRRSHPKLTDPAPQGVQLENIFKAALRAPDHARMHPWRFLVAEGETLDQLGEAFADAAAMDPDMDAAQVVRAKNLPLRAPMVVVAIAVLNPSKKVPEVEQLISAGCAVQAMQQAAFAQGFGGIWRTGTYAYNQQVNEALNVKSNEQIVGFLYLGTPNAEPPRTPEMCSSDFFEYL